MGKSQATSVSTHVQKAAVGRDFGRQQWEAEPAAFSNTMPDPLWLGDTWATEAAFGDMATDLAFADGIMHVADPMPFAEWGAWGTSDELSGAVSSAPWAGVEELTLDLAGNWTVDEPAYVVPWATAPPGLETKVIAAKATDAFLAKAFPELGLPLQEDESSVGVDVKTRATSFCSSASTADTRSPHRRRRCQMLLATQLKNLEEEDADCIVHVRQIHKLGFESSEVLQEYCEQFGPVKRVALSNAHEKLGGAPFPVRVRPSGIGFVVMQTREDAAAVLAAGSIQLIQGVKIMFRRFFAKETPASPAASDVSTTCSEDVAVSDAAEVASEASQGYSD